MAEYADGVWWRNGTWQNGLDWYRSLFQGGELATARGEASTTYSKWPDYPGVARRIAETVPDVRLVYVVRDPIQRMRSHYQHDVVRHAQHRTIDQAFADDAGYLNASRYSTQITQYLDYFDISQLLVVKSDDLRSDREATVRKIYRFIGVSDDILPATLDTEMYRSTERRIHTRTFARLRGRGFIHFLPSSLRVAGRKALTRPPVDELPQPSSETVEMLREELRGEMEGLRPSSWATTSTAGACSNPSRPKRASRPKAQRQRTGALPPARPHTGVRGRAAGSLSRCCPLDRGRRSAAPSA